MIVLYSNTTNTALMCCTNCFILEHLNYIHILQHTLLFELMEYISWTILNLKNDWRRICLFVFTHVIKYITYRYAIEYSPLLWHWWSKSRTRQWHSNINVQTSCWIKFWHLKRLTCTCNNSFLHYVVVFTYEKILIKNYQQPLLIFWFFIFFLFF